MAALFGSSTATATIISQIAILEIKKQCFDDRLKLRTVAAGKTFTVTIPPNVALILYEIIIGTSISDLSPVGIIHSILTLSGYALVIRLWSSQHKYTR